MEDFLRSFFSQEYREMASSSTDKLQDIKKLDGSNFPFWKKQIMHVLVLKKYAKPIRCQGIKPEDMDQDEWEEMDQLAHATILLSLHESVYFNVAEETTSYGVWEKLCSLYDKQSAASQVYWLKKLFDLKMKEGTPMSNHLNAYNIIFSQLSAQGVKFEDSVKAMILLVTLPDSWDTFRTALSNSAPATGLTSASVEGSLLTEEVNRKNLDSGKGSSALVVRGRSNARDSSDDRGKSHNKSREPKKKNIKCFYCKKKGHMKKDCHKWKIDKGKDKEEKKSSTSSVKIEEVNTAEVDDGDIFLTSELEHASLTTSDETVMSDWIIDSGASFHVTPHRGWFTSYDASRKGSVRLGNDQSCEVVGVGDVQLQFQNGSSFTLRNVRHVPKLTRNLISTG